ncbi:MAG TPA: cupin domain-containing protein [Gaiellaceae bacterium]|nr:cupin domain-containing protein [Gaiellaceae bacterium]
MSDDGAYVVNARDVPWRQREGLGRWANLEGDRDFDQLGFQLVVVDPGEPVCMYHGESTQEDFLVVSGECVLVIEGEERQLKRWDFVHCPPMTEHVFVGAGDGPCAIVMVGARVPIEEEEIIYPANEAAARHGASVEVDTPDPAEAYAPFARRDPSPYREGDLPDLA